MYVCEDCVQSLWGDIVVDADLKRTEKELRDRIGKLGNF